MRIAYWRPLLRTWHFNERGNSVLLNPGTSIHAPINGRRGRKKLQGSQLSLWVFCQYRQVGEAMDRWIAQQKSELTYISALIFPFSIFSSIFLLSPRRSRSRAPIDGAKSARLLDCLSSILKRAFPFFLTSILFFTVMMLASFSYVQVQTRTLYTARVSPLSSFITRVVYNNYKH